MFGKNNFKSRELYFQVACSDGWFFVDAVSFLKEYFGLALDEPWPWETKNSKIELSERSVLETIESEKFHNYCISRIEESDLNDLYELDENSAPLIPFRPKTSLLSDQWDSRSEVKPVWQASDFYLQLDGVDFEKLQREYEIEKFLKKQQGGKGDA